MSNKIFKLEETVINRIAAGEIIHRPANALKEMIENALDAGSTQINVTTKDGGLKLLSIQDNGHGISKQDLTIVCERFTTSKLKEFDDLKLMSTYGFRGEALASISHIAHVTITSKTKHDPCAYKATYRDGKLVPLKPGTSADPKPCAGNQGTTIVVEDLFFNVVTRKKILKSPSEEYAKILDVMQKYAILNAHAAFTCKKQGFSSTDLVTTSNSTPLQSISLIYGPLVAKELLSLEHESKGLYFKARGHVSHPNFNSKKMVFILFINKRLVEHRLLKKSLEELYSLHLPKGTHPFIYLDLSIKPENVDVNVHPTKKEVHFLNEEEIVQDITLAVEDLLKTTTQSRKFYVQTFLPGTSAVDSPKDSKKELEVQASGRALKTPEYHLVRTDSRTRALESFIDSSQSYLASQETPSKKPCVQYEHETHTHHVSPSLHLPQTILLESPMTPNNIQEDKYDKFKQNLFSTPIPSSSSKSFVDVQLTSILQLRGEVFDAKHLALEQVIKEHTFVGIVDGRKCLIQHRTRLYMVNYHELSYHLFYQLGLKAFINFGRFQFDEPISIKEMISAGLNVSDFEELKSNTGTCDEDIIESIKDILIDHRDMLDEYFGMTILESGHLFSIPILLKSYIPSLIKLPEFLVRLGTQVYWDTEKECFETFLQQLAWFYQINPHDFISQHSNQYHHKIEHVLFPAFKQHLLPAKTISNSFQILANLPDLYKVFERC